MRYWDFAKRKMKYAAEPDSIIFTAYDIWNKGLALADVYNCYNGNYSLLKHGEVHANYISESVRFYFTEDKLYNTISVANDRYIIKLGNKGVDISKYQYMCMICRLNLDGVTNAVSMNMTTENGTYNQADHKLFHRFDYDFMGATYKLVAKIDQRFGKGTIATSVYGTILQPPGTQSLCYDAFYVYCIGFFKTIQDANNFNIGKEINHVLYLD